MDDAVQIYVMPTEEGMPARAMLTKMSDVELVDDEVPDGAFVLSVKQAMATWTADQGCWTIEGSALPTELNDAISAHAANLGVPGF